MWGRERGFLAFSFTFTNVLGIHMYSPTDLNHTNPGIGRKLERSTVSLGSHMNTTLLRSRGPSSTPFVSFISQWKRTTTMRRLLLREADYHSDYETARELVKSVELVQLRLLENTFCGRFMKHATLMTPENDALPFAMRPWRYSQTQISTNAS